MATKYNKAWEDAAKYPHFASWIQRANMDSQFRCKLCGGKDLNLGNMGQRALVSHLEGKKHAAIVSTMRSSSRLSLTGTSSFSQPEITIAGPTNTIETTEVNNLTTGSKLISYDVSNGLLPMRSIDIGFGASAAIKRIKTLQEQDKLGFYKNCQSLLIALFKKIAERSPLKYSLTRAISALSPELMKSNPNRSTDRFKLLCEKLLELKHITSIQADAALKQFKTLLSVEKFKTALNNFDRNSDRVDCLFAEHIYDAGYQELWHIVLIVLKLGHGNAQVESGFSVNKDLLVPNLQQRSLVALRRVYDSIKGLNPASITVSQEMMKYARNAHSRYESAKIRDRENRSVAQKRALEKKALSEELKKLQSKRQKKASEIGTELSKIDSDILDLKTKLNNI